MDEVIPGLFLIEGGGNIYLGVMDDGLILVDAGMPKKQDLILAAIQEAGHQPADLKHILITHADIDHVGSLAAILALTPATVYASADTAVHLANGESPPHMPRFVQFIIDRFMKYQPVGPERLVTVADGETLPFWGGIEVIATPGHTLDHHAYFCPQWGVLFAGDALNTRHGRINCTPKRITADQEAAYQSAIRLFSLAPAVLACGHGQPSTDHSSNDLMQAFNALRQE